MSVFEETSISGKQEKRKKMEKQWVSYSGPTHTNTLTHVYLSSGHIVRNVKKCIHCQSVPHKMEMVQCETGVLSASRNTASTAQRHPKASKQGPQDKSSPPTVNTTPQATSLPLLPAIISSIKGMYSIWKRQKCLLGCRITSCYACCSAYRQKSCLQWDAAGDVHNDKSTVFQNFG